MLANYLSQQERGNGSDHKRNRCQSEWMRQCSSVPIFAMRKGAQKFCNSRAKINRKAQDRSQLDHDRVHLPISISEIDVKQRFGNSQVRRGTDGQKFGQTFNDAKHDGQQIVVQGPSLPASMAESWQGMIV